MLGRITTLERNLSHTYEIMYIILLQTRDNIKIWTRILNYKKGQNIYVYKIKFDL